MKLLIDAHLPASICKYFEGCDCLHTEQLEDGNLTKDSDINHVSIKEKRVVFTKDTDFYYSFIAKREPYKLVLIKLGNIRLTKLKNYFQKNSNNILTLLEKHYFLILEIDRIRIME